MRRLLREQNVDEASTTITAGLRLIRIRWRSGFLGSTLLRQLTISIDYRDGLVKFDDYHVHGTHNF